MIKSTKTRNPVRNFAASLAVLPALLMSTCGGGGGGGQFVSTWGLAHINDTSTMCLGNRSNVSGQVITSTWRVRCDGSTFVVGECVRGSIGQLNSDNSFNC